MFNPEMECTAYDVIKELETDLKPTYILEKACPLCPKRPMPEHPNRKDEGLRAYKYKFMQSLVKFTS